MYLQLTIVNTMSAYPINVLLNVLIKAYVQWVSYYALLPVPKTPLYFKITLLLPGLLASWSIACLQSCLGTLILPPRWLPILNYTLIHGPTCAFLHNMASNLSTWPHLPLFASITPLEHFYIQPFVYAVPSFETTFSTICSPDNLTSPSRPSLSLHQNTR